MTCSAGSFDYIRGQMIQKVTAETWHKSTAFQNLTPFVRAVVLEHVNSINVNIYRHWVATESAFPSKNSSLFPMRSPVKDYKAYLKNSKGENNDH